MNRRRLLRAALGCATLGAAGSPAGSLAAPAQASSVDVPRILDLDPPYVKTPQIVVDAMLELAGVGPGDRLLDLGSGDGRIVVTAAQRWATPGLGVEIDPALVALARRNARAAGVERLARFVVQDLFETDLSQASVITMYLLPDVNMKLRPRLRELRPGTRIVSHDWDLGDWKPVHELEVTSTEKRVAPIGRSRLMLWIV